MAAAVAGVGRVERLLDLAHVAVVLRALLGVEVDLDDLHARLGELEADVLGGLELAVAEDDVAQLMEVREAGDRRAHLDLHRGVHDGLHLDAQVAVDELLGVADAAARPGLRVDVLHEVVDLERAVTPVWRIRIGLRLRARRDSSTRRSNQLPRYA